MSSVDTLFATLKSQGKKALMPFITAGDPDVEFTAELLKAFDQRGCHLAEVGLPYSDPIADGPVIQASYSRALDKKIKVSQILEMTKKIQSDISMPLVTMTSYTIVYRHGAEAFIDHAKESGISGAIVPDLPIDESESLAKVCRERDFSLIQLVTPTTPQERAKRIADLSTGFIYFVSVTGITGERTELPPDLVDNVGWLRNQTNLPICIGFGINRPEHVRMLKEVADGLIVGSAFVKRLAEIPQKSKETVLKEMGDYASTLLDALNE